jgi:hypothetical protein
MSNLNRGRRATARALTLTAALLLGAALTAGPARAEVERKPPHLTIAGQNGAAATSPAPAQTDGEKADPSSAAAAPDGGRGGSDGAIRCWQYGRLIFEGRDVALAGRSDEVITLRGASKGAMTLQIIDLKNATCIAESRTR